MSIIMVEMVWPSLVVNPDALRTAKTLWSFGCSECNRVKSDSNCAIVVAFMVAINCKSKFSRLHFSGPTLQ